MVVALISISSAFAQNNISSVYQASLSAELASCPLRDQILRVNQLAALEYVDRAFFEGLMVSVGLAWHFDCDWLLCLCFLPL